MVTTEQTIPKTVQNLASTATPLVRKSSCCSGLAMNGLEEDKFPCELRNSLRFRGHAREGWGPGKNLKRTVVNDLPVRQVSVEIIDQKDASTHLCPHRSGKLLQMTQETDKRLNLSDHSWYVCSCLVAQLCRTLVTPWTVAPPGSSVHGISQRRILEWVAISFSRGSSWPRDQTLISCLAGRSFTFEPLGRPLLVHSKGYSHCRPGTMIIFHSILPHFL